MANPIAGIVGGSIVSGVLGARASSKAAKAQAQASTQAAAVQAQASREAIAEQRRQFDIARADQLAAEERARADIAPWMETGRNALLTLGGEVDPLTAKYTAADLETDPGYQFRLAQGEQALRRAQAAKGARFGGRALKEAQRFGQGLASQEFGAAYGRFQDWQANRYNRLANLAGLGQSAASNSAGVTTATSGNIAGQGLATGARVGNLLMQGGAAQGRGLLGAGAAQAQGYLGAASALNNATQGGIQNYLLYKMLG